MSNVFKQNCSYLCDSKRKMKGIFILFCIIGPVFLSLEGVVEKEKQKTKDNADQSIGNVKPKLHNTVSVDKRHEQDDQNWTKLNTRHTTGVRILYPFSVILSTLGIVSEALSTLVQTLVALLDVCLRIPVNTVQVLLCGFIDITLYLLLDIILKVIVKNGFTIIIWIPYKIFDLMLNTIPVEAVITKYVAVADFILHKVVLKITVIAYWLSAFIVVIYLSCYILHQARIITMPQWPTSRDAIKTIFRTMTIKNLQNRIKDTTAMHYTFLILLTLFMSFNSVYTFIPASRYILRNLVLKSVPVIYWAIVAIVTSYILCKIVILIHKQKHIVLNPVYSRLSSLWNSVSTHKEMTMILHKVFDQSVCHVVYNAIHACFKSVVGNGSIRRTLSMINQNVLSVRSNVLSILHGMKDFVSWFPTRKDKSYPLTHANARHTSTGKTTNLDARHTSTGRTTERNARHTFKGRTTNENARHTSTGRTDNTFDSYEGIRKEKVASNKKYDREKVGILKSRARSRKIDKEEAPAEAGNQSSKENGIFETNSNLKNRNIGEEMSFDNVIDDDDAEDVYDFQDAHETSQVVDTEELPSGNIQIIMSSLDPEIDLVKPTDRKFMGNVYIHDEVEDKPIWDVKGTKE